LKGVLSEPTLSKHLGRMVTSDYLNLKDKRYELTKNGAQHVGFLRDFIKQFSQKADPTLVKPDLMRYSVTPATGKTGSIQFCGLVHQWGASEIPQETINKTVQDMVKSLPLKGKGTVKVSVEITFAGS